MALLEERKRRKTRGNVAVQTLLANVMVRLETKDGKGEGVYHSTTQM